MHTLLKLENYLCAALRSGEERSDVGTGARDGAEGRGARHGLRGARRRGSRCRLHERRGHRRRPAPQRLLLRHVLHAAIAQAHGGG